MRLERFDLNLLIALDALLETCNVTKAGEMLNITQSSCSHALGRLREHFGDELLVPMGRRFVLTPLAEEMREPVRDALRHTRSVVARRADFVPAEASETFELCCSDYIVSVLIAPLSRALAHEAPGIRLRMRSGPGDWFVAFERGNLDLLVVPSSLQLQAAHGRQRLFTDDIVGIVCKEHLRGSAALTHARLDALEHVVVKLGSESGITSEALQFPGHHGRWKVACEVDRFNLMPLFVQGTSRVAMLPRQLTKQFVQQYPVRIAELPKGMTPRLEMDLVWSRHVHDSRAHRWLRQRLTAEAQHLDVATPSRPSRS